MSYLQRISWIVGSALLGFSAVVVLQRSDSAERLRKRQSEQPPVEELAANLKQAWAGYHTP